MECIEEIELTKKQNGKGRSNRKHGTLVTASRTKRTHRTGRTLLKHIEEVEIMERIVDIEIM